MDTQEPLYDGRSQLRDLARLVLKARRSLRWAIPLALLLGAAAGVYSQIREGSYTCEAVAIVRSQPSPESVSSTAQAAGAQEAVSGGPIPLDVTDYRMLLTSDMILENATDIYNRQYGEGLTLGAIRRMVYAEERLKLKSPYSVEYYPTLQMQAVAKSPDMAYAVLNAWIEAAKEWAHKVAFDAKEDIFEYVDVEYSSARDELVSLEENLNNTRAESEDLKDQLVGQNTLAEEDHLLETIRLKRELSDEWDDKIAEAKQTYQLETLQKISDLSNQWEKDIMQARAEYNLPFHEQKVDQLIVRSINVEGKLGEAEIELAEAQARMAELQEQARQHPEMIVLAKAITDDALWENRTQDKRLESLKLRTEEVNPVMVAIKNDIRATQVRLAALPVTQERLKADLSALQTEIEKEQTYIYSRRLDIDTLERAKASALEALDIERTLGLGLLTEKIVRQKEGAIRALEASRENSLNLLKRSGETALGKLDRDRSFKEQRVQRDLDTQSGIFDSLTTSRLRAKMAVANTIEEFAVLSTPTMQTPKRGSLLMGGIMGGVVFVVAVFGLFMLSLFRIFFAELATTAERELETQRA